MLLTEYTISEISLRSIFPVAPVAEARIFITCNARRTVLTLDSGARSSRSSAEPALVRSMIRASRPRAFPIFQQLS
ncbi:hypothetical protein IEQ34_016018 [Dendrobium chrysotoxum]|uniref:Uncharacterized protein n=1 Tax=Dendrobium chrysotoxum TaxID=161865 RepID=A0AAV7FWW5_DENCH|nr:hypothetical protein IEQ34_016018 [Dendrobium chrysotoxum]